MKDKKRLIRVGTQWERFDRLALKGYNKSRKKKVIVDKDGWEI